MKYLEHTKWNIQNKIYTVAYIYNLELRVKFISFPVLFEFEF